MSDTLQREPIAPEQEEAAPRGNRRLVVGAVIGVAVLVVLGVAYFLLISGGGSTDTLAPITPGAAPTAAPSGSPAASKAPHTNHNNLGRNPFKPLAAEATPPPAPSASASAAPTAGTTPTAAAVSGAYTVEVNSADAAKGTATITVNGVQNTGVKVGDKLPKNQTIQFQVTSISKQNGQTYVGFQFGDGSISMLPVGVTHTYTTG